MNFHNCFRPKSKAALRKKRRASPHRISTNENPAQGGCFLTRGCAQDPDRASTSEFRVSATAGGAAIGAVPCLPPFRISGTHVGGMEKLSPEMQASLAELRAAGTGLADGEACGTFDWIVDFPDFAHMVTPEALRVPEPRRVLVVGCGTSTLSEDLLGAGYEKVTSADIDAAQVAHMQDKTQESHPGLAWVVADMTKCEEELPDAEAFELIFDKGTLDALLCTDEASHMICEIVRLLAPQGVYAVISFRPNEFITKLLAVPGLPLEIQASRIPMTSTTREAHLYVVRKTASCGKPSVDTVKEYQDAIIKWWHVEGDPLLTADKEKDIERQFKARLPADSPHGRLELSACHEVLFEEEMRDEYGYDLDAFRADVEAFLEDSPGRGGGDAGGGLTLVEALAFLKEMQ